jgi:hypothetical protein
MMNACMAHRRNICVLRKVFIAAGLVSISWFFSGCAHHLTALNDSRLRPVTARKTAFETAFIASITESNRPPNHGELADPSFSSRSLAAVDFQETSEFRLETIDSLPSHPGTSTASVAERLMSDQWRFYSPDSILLLGLTFGAGGIMANTQMDEQFQRHFHSSVMSATSDEWSEKLHASKELGDGRYSLPVFGVMWLVNEWVDGPPPFETTGLWGERSMRGFLVGAPVVVVGQYATGGSRPSELQGSHWDSFQDNNGVSGHAFMSALPFITAAKMTKNPFAKSVFYAGSTIGPLSRMNDNAHYPSQVGMGWCVAFLAASAVDPNTTRNGWSVKPLATGAGSGMAAEYKW